MSEIDCSYHVYWYYMFMERRGEPVVEFDDEDWMCEFAAAVDITILSKAIPI